VREQITLCDAGDVFTIPANLEKSFDQISRGVAHVFSSGALPLMLGGDHSIGFPCVRGIAQCTSRRIGIIHFDRHIDIQEKDLDERMHTTPWYWATNLPNVPATNLVQLGIGGWQVPRYGVAEARKRGTNVLTIDDIERIGLDRAAEIALELAWKDADAVYISFDVDSVDCGSASRPCAASSRKRPTGPPRRHLGPGKLNARILQFDRPRIGTRHRCGTVKSVTWPCLAANGSRGLSAVPLESAGR
jgi:arginase family enzyme